MWQMIPGTANFLSGEMLTAAPELALLYSVATQMADRYGFPNWATAGLTDSKTLDAQAGYEQALSVPLVMMSGPTYISAISGFMQSVCVVSYEKFVMDHELIRMARRRH